MAEVVFVIAGLAFIVFLIAFYWVFGALRARFISGVLGRATRDVYRATGIAAPDDPPEEKPAGGLDGMFDVLAGRNPEAARPHRRTGAGPVEAGAAIEDLEARDPK